MDSPAGKHPSRSPRSSSHRNQNSKSNRLRSPKPRSSGLRNYNPQIGSLESKPRANMCNDKTRLRAKVLSYSNRSPWPFETTPDSLLSVF